MTQPARIALRVVVVVLMLAAGTATAAVAVSQTSWFRNWLRGYIVAEAHQFINGELSIGRLDGNLFYGVQLRDVAIAVDGKPIVQLDRLALDYNAFHLVTSGISADDIQLVKPTIYLRHDDTGWPIARLIRRQEQEADRTGPKYPITADTISITDGTIVIDDVAGTPNVDLPDRVEHVNADLSFHYTPVRYSLDIRGLTFQGSSPSLALNAMTGGIALKDDDLFLDKIAIKTSGTTLSLDGAIERYLSTPMLKIQVASDRMDLGEIGGLVPAVRDVALAPTFDVKLDGPLDRLGVAGNISTSAGTAHAQLTADVQTPGQSVAGTVSLEYVNLAPLVNNPAQTSDLSGTVRVDVAAESFADLDSLRGTASLSTTDAKAAGYEVQKLDADAQIAGRSVTLSARGAAYGADLTADGRVNIPRADEPLAFDVSGRAEHINLRHLPRALNAPAVATNISAAYHAAGAVPLGEAAASGTKADVALTLADSDAPGVHVAAGSTATVHVRGRALSYDADAQVTGLNLQAVGESFAIAGLNDPRLASDINGRLVANGSGTSLADLALHADGQLAESRIAGGAIPDASISAVIAHGRATISGSGEIAGLDPAVVSGKPEAAGDINLWFSTTATIDDLPHGVKPESVAATLQAAFQPSRVGELAFERGTLDADYRNEIAEIRTLDLGGPDLNATAHGTLALAATGNSNLVVHIDSSRLEEIGRIVEQPLAGIAQIDATVSGNRGELRAKGTAKGSGIKYGENGALSLSADFTATVPELDYSRAHVDADTNATFVTIAGQDINEVQARLAYDTQRLDFNGQARQPERTLNAAGSLLLHPDHQEVHLQQLALATGNQQWQMKEGGAATVKYGGDAIDIDRLELVSGDQTIAASGRFGQPGDHLDVTVTNVNLTSVDALLLRPPQFSGRLDASAQISGTKNAPDVDAKFQVTNGGFRQFTYETLGGTASYSPDGIELDARLQQNASQWITAKGHVPTTVFGSNAAPAGEDTGHVESSGTDRIDLAIDSSPLGLGLIQGFTTAVSDVQGTMEAHVRVTGSGRDPHAEGAVTVADGALTVVPTGVAYSNIRGKVDLQPDRVHIDEITVLDNHDAALSITGDVAVHEREVSAGQLWITGDDFKVIDNELGNVRIQSALEIAGRVTSPVIRGDLGITTGRVNLDEILAAFGTSVYSTEAAKPADDSAPSEPASSSSSTSSKPTFENLRINVRVTVPDDLVVKASELRAPNATIGLGALTVTLGGDLTVTKEQGQTTRLVGAVNTVRGTYDFQGRRFEILRDGTIRFENEDQLDPVLDIRTRRIIQGVEARVDVRGRMRAPEIALSSTPPLDEADILSLIVFNQPVNQLGVGEQVSLTARAQSLAVGAVAGQLSSAIGTALNLDTFEINVAPENGGGPELTVGQQLGQNVYFKIQQGVGDNATTNVVLEFELTNWLRLQTNLMQGGSESQMMFRRRQGSGADLIVLFQK